MYYLPEYRVYQIDSSTSPTGEERKTFWGGTHRETSVTDNIVLPESIKTFLLIINEEENIERYVEPEYVKLYLGELSRIEGIRIQQLKPMNMYLVSGDIDLYFLN